MVNIENWIPKYIFGYLLYFIFIVYIIGSTTVINTNIYYLTTEQIEILSEPSTDPISFLSKAYILSSINSGYALVNIFTFLTGLIFLFAIFKALKEIIPALPS